MTKVVDIQNEIDLPNLDNTICNEDPKSGICGATLPYSRSCQKSYSRTKLPKNSGVFTSGTLHKQSSQVLKNKLILKLLSIIFICIFFFFV